MRFIPFVRFGSFVTTKVAKGHTGNALHPLRALRVLGGEAGVQWTHTII